MAGLEVRAADHVEHRHSHSERPARVDPQQVLHGNLGLVPLLEAQAAQPHLGAPEQQGQDRPPVRPRQRHVQLGEHDVERAARVLQVSADEELLRRPPVKVDRSGGARVLRRREVRLGRFGAAAGVGQGVAELDLQLRPLGGRAHAQVEREAVEAGRPVEREGLGCFRRRRRRILGGRLRIARAVVVHGQHLRIGTADREQRRGQPVVAFLQGLGRQARHHGVADAVVVRLDLLAAERAAGPHQVRRAQDRLRAFALLLQIGGPVGHAHVDRHPGHRDHVEEAPRERWQPGHAGCDDVVERDLHGRGLSVGLGETHELLDEIRVAPGLARDRFRRRVPRPRLAGDQRLRQLLRLRGRQLADDDVPHLQGRIGRPLGQDALEQRSGIGFLASIAPDQQERGRIRRAHQVFEQGPAVHVPPLQVVDEEHERPAVGHPHEQLSQGLERAALQLERVGDVEDRPAGAVHGADLAEHGEYLRQREDVVREESLRLRRREAPKVTAQGVDEGVECLVGNRLPLVAAPDEDHRLAVRVLQLHQEAPDERALAHPGAAVDRHDDGPSRFRGLERIAQRRQMLFAADEERGARGKGRGQDRGGRSHQRPEHLASGRPGGRIPAQQVPAQLVEVARDAGGELMGRRRLTLLFPPHDFWRGTGERKSPGERLVEHGPDVVPIAGLRERKARHLLGRHVRRRSPLIHRMRMRRVELRDEAEVEEHHAPLASDEDVRRLDVPVELSGVVQGQHAFGELRQRASQAGQVQLPPRSPLDVADVRCGLGGDRGHRLAVRGLEDTVRPEADPRRQPARRARLGRVCLAADVPEEVHPFDQLHREEPLLVAGGKLVEGHEVGVRDVGEGPELLLEAHERRGRDVSQRLEGDDHVPLPVDRAVDDAVAARAEALLDLEPVGPDEILRVEPGHRRYLTKGLACGQTLRPCPGPVNVDPAAPTSPRRPATVIPLLARQGQHGSPLPPLQPLRRGLPVPGVGHARGHAARPRDAEGSVPAARAGRAGGSRRKAG